MAIFVIGRVIEATKNDGTALQTVTIGTETYKIGDPTDILYKVTANFGTGVKEYNDIVSMRQTLGTKRIAWESGQHVLMVKTGSKGREVIFIADEEPIAFKTCN